MIVVILLIAFLSYQLLSLRRVSKLAKEAVRERKAVFLDCDISSKFRELLDDPTMTTQKWKEWLPIFKSADEEVKSKCNLNLGGNSDLIQAIISNGDLADQ